ncbi:hypothetical protein PHMEG_00022214 [Phytophthora megakarya]|uniref:Uncharacterized protein n=1 Tax=Phytophthora megakarya TaxID=4795 RepID=A0A225VJC1_9STRA|nr:hypothetical protein PHMEG_00022214 [Phytophthora megakarya]
MFGSLPHGPVHGWWKERDKLQVFKGDKLGKTTKGQERKESFLFTPALVIFMKDTYYNLWFLTTSCMISSIHDNYVEWLDTYLYRKKSLESGHRAPERQLQRTTDGYVFATQKRHDTKLPSVDLQRIKSEFALEFWIKYSMYSESEIYNVNETEIQFDMPPYI